MARLFYMTFNVMDVERLERAELDILVTLYRNPHVNRYDDQIYEVHSQRATTRYRIIPEPERKRSTRPDVNVEV